MECNAVRHKEFTRRPLEHEEFRKVHPTPDVMPAKAGIHLFFGVVRIAWRWIPAFAGMTQ
jgi:hypothetical protein